MKKEVIILVIIILIILLAFGYSQLTGKAINENSAGGPSAGAGGAGGEMGGPSEEQQACMRNCYMVEKKGEDVCMQECNMEPQPESADEGEACMQECVVVGCEEHDFQCERNNKEKCEDECGMKGDAPDESEMSEEQLCITRCVAAVDPEIRCGASQTGETGGEVCQRCSAECVHLYAGPCLNDEQLKSKQKECETCEHCYGEPVMGDSGEGWDCIVDVECNDASGEFGDEPGTGPGIAKAVGDAIGNVIQGIGDFFKGLFGGGENPIESTGGEE